MFDGESPVRGNKHGDVAMHRRQASVKRGDLAISPAGEVTEIGVGDLSVADDVDDHSGSERKVVRPELVPRQRLDPLEGDSDVAGSVTGSQQVTNQGSLRDRTGGEGLVPLAEPICRLRVMNVVRVDQGDEDVRIEQDAHSSSSSRRTSSVVTGWPDGSKGNPVRLSTTSTCVVDPSARRSSSVTAMLNVQPRSWASDVAIAWRSSGRSMVVRTLTS